MRWRPLVWKSSSLAACQLNRADGNASVASAISIHSACVLDAIQQADKIAPADVSNGLRSEDREHQAFEGPPTEVEAAQVGLASLPRFRDGLQ